MHGGVYAGMRV